LAAQCPEQGLRVGKPSASFAQQPTATIKTLSGNVLVSGQAATIGTTLRAGDTIQTQAGASAVLELSDGSEIQLGENTQINIDNLTQTATGARVSYIKLLAGRLRAFLSSEHQQEGSSFTIETPNAQLGVKFSEPDIEVSYNPESVETVGIAHTVELMAKNLLTDEEVLVPVGSTVIIVGTTVKIVAGILAIARATEAGTAGVGATSAGTSSTGSSGMGTGTKVALGLGAAAAAGGAVALATSAGDGGESETAESTGDLSGWWSFTGSCVGQGCTEDIGCAGPPLPPDLCCGINFCNPPCTKVDHGFQVSQTGNTLLGQEPTPTGPIPIFLNGVVEGNSVSFTTPPSVNIPIPPDNGITNYTGTLEGNTIRGTLSGSGYAAARSGMKYLTWSGTFTVTIQK